MAQGVPKPTPLERRALRREDGAIQIQQKTRKGTMTGLAKIALHGEGARRP
jgi:hypothetical protein